MIQTDAFGPSKIKTTFCIAANDYAISVIIPSLLMHLRGLSFREEHDNVIESESRSDVIQDNERQPLSLLAAHQAAKQLTALSLTDIV